MIKIYSVRFRPRKRGYCFDQRPTFESVVFFVVWAYWSNMDSANLFVEIRFAITDLLRSNKLSRCTTSYPSRHLLSHGRQPCNSHEQTTLQTPIHTKKSFSQRTFFSMVPRTRLELTRANAHYPLKVACLPIPPPGL